MGTTTRDTAGAAGGARGRLDVTDLPLEQVRAYARWRPGGDLHLERRGGRTYLVATG